MKETTLQPDAYWEDNIKIYLTEIEVHGLDAPG